MIGRLPTVIVGVAATLGLLALEAPFVQESGRVLGPSSEGMMQTASLADLQLQPWRTLWFLHIGPPAFDALRAAIAHLAGRGQPYERLVVTVDVWLLRLWAVGFGLTIALIAVWIGRLREKTGLGVALAVLWALQPPALLYPMHLDTTILGGLGMLWCAYETWRGRPLAAGLAVGLLFLTRSHFQWPFALLVALALRARGMQWRRLGLFAAVVALVMVPLYAKQWVLFRLPTTSSYLGYNGCHSLGLPVYVDPLPLDHVVPGAQTARTLTRRWKPLGPRNYNQLEWLKESRALERAYREALRSTSPAELLAAYTTNTRILLEPTSSFARSPITRRLPWRRAYDWISSGWRLLLLCALGGAVWLGGCPWRKAVARFALAGPPLYVVAVSILFERAEGMRYRYFVEPVTYVFLVASAAEVARRASSWRRRGAAAPAGSAAASPAVCG